jgi:hypothetical protein
MDVVAVFGGSLSSLRHRQPKPGPLNKVEKMTYPPPPGTPSPDLTGNPPPAGGYPPPSVPPQPQPKPHPQYGQPPAPPYRQPVYGQEPPTRTTPIPGYGQPGYPPPPGQGTDPYRVAAPAPKKGKTAKILSSVSGFVAVLCVIVAIKAVPAIIDKADDSTPTHVQPSGIFATSDADSAPTAPFEDTPAAHFPEGEAGIALPAATAVPGFTKAKVDAALKKVKQALVLNRLDSKTLLSHDTSALLAMLAPDARGGVKKDFTDRNFFIFATHIASGYSLTSDPIKVKGRVTFRGATNDNIRMLEVTTNFVWVYPFSGELKETGDHLVIVHDEITWAFPVDVDVEKGSRGMWIYEANGFASNIDCVLLDQSLIALGKPQLLAPGASQDEDAPFDPDGTLEIDETC